jgi:pyrophosphatase PpaX
VTALVTSGSRRRVQAELAAHRLDHCFAAAVFFEDVSRRKPHPEAVSIALERLRVTPAAAAFVGDSPEDIVMARAAGVFSVAVPGPFPNRRALEAAQPDLLAPDLSAAAEALIQRASGLS